MLYLCLEGRHTLSRKTATIISASSDGNLLHCTHTLLITTTLLYYRHVKASTMYFVHIFPRRVDFRAAEGA